MAPGWVGEGKQTNAFRELIKKKKMSQLIKLMIMPSASAPTWTLLQQAD